MIKWERGIKGVRAFDKLVYQLPPLGGIDSFNRFMVIHIYKIFYFII